MPQFLIDVFAVLAALFVIAVGTVVLAVIVLYVADRLQTRHAVRRNFPVIGRLRYTFEHLGKFFRQYFFAADREELPFNRRSATGPIARPRTSTIRCRSVRPATWCPRARCCSSTRRSPASRATRASPRPW